MKRAMGHGQSRTPQLAALVALACLPGAGAAWAQGAAPPAPAAPAAAPACKAYGGSKCCDPNVTLHLPRQAVFSACGESEASYLGEKGSKDTCRYVFKTDDGKESFVEVYAPAQKEVPPSPTDPFFAWRKVGKVFVTDKAKDARSKPMLETSTGLWMPGAGFMVSVNAQTKVCTKPEALRLAKSVR
jgi:hypothetical protein